MVRGLSAKAAMHRHSLQGVRSWTQQTPHLSSCAAYRISACLSSTLCCGRRDCLYHVEGLVFQCFLEHYIAYAFCLGVISHSADCAMHTLQRSTPTIETLWAALSTGSVSAYFRIPRQAPLPPSGNSTWWQCYHLAAKSIEPL